MLRDAFHVDIPTSASWLISSSGSFVKSPRGASAAAYYFAELPGPLQYSLYGELHPLFEPAIDAFLQDYNGLICDPLH